MTFLVFQSTLQYLVYRWFLLFVIDKRVEGCTLLTILSNLFHLSIINDFVMNFLNLTDGSFLIQGSVQDLWLIICLWFWCTWLAIKSLILLMLHASGNRQSMRKWLATSLFVNLLGIAYWSFKSELRCSFMILQCIEILLLLCICNKLSLYFREVLILKLWKV